MLSVITEINSLANTYCYDIEELFGRPFDDVMSDHLDMDTIMRYSDNNISKERLEEINKSVEEFKLMLLRMIAKRKGIDTTDRKSSLLHIFCDNKLSDIEAEKTSTSYLDITNQLLKRYNKNYLDIRTAAENILEAEIYSRIDSKITLNDIGQRCGHFYSYNFMDMLATCLAYELDRNIPIEKFDETMEKLTEKFEGYRDIAAILVDIHSIYDLFSQIGTTEISYILGKISKDKNNWPYGDAFETIREKLKKFKLSPSGAQKLEMLGFDNLDKMPINTAILLSVLREIVESCTE